MTNATKKSHAVITYRNPDNPEGLALRRTPYEPEDGDIVWLITMPQDLMLMPTKALLTAYNLATGKSIKMFNTRPKGVSQTFAALQEWLGRTSSTEPVPNADTATTMKTAKKTAKKKTVTAPKKTRGRPSTFSLNAKITVLVDKNPRRGAAAKRFDLYRTGMLLGTFLEKGGERGDVLYDSRHGYISVTES